MHLSKLTEKIYGILNMNGNFLELDFIDHTDLDEGYICMILKDGSSFSININMDND